MDKRYELLKKLEVRNIQEYNEKCKSQTNVNKYKFLPYLILTISEIRNPNMFGSNTLLNKSSFEINSSILFLSLASTEIAILICFFLKGLAAKSHRKGKFERRCNKQID